MKGLLLLGILFILQGAFAEDYITFAEKQLNIEEPFSNNYFKWIKDDVALALTQTGQATEVFRTNDSAKTWISLKSLMAGSEVQESRPARIYVNPVDPTKIYIRGESTISWISTDMGATWAAITPKNPVGEPKRFVGVIWNPKNSDWALSAVDVGANYAEIYYTKDMGRTWTFISRAYQYSWGDAGQGNVPDSTVYLLTLDASSGWTDFVVTTDFGMTTSVIQSKTLQFLFLDKQLFSLIALPTSLEAVLKVTPDIGNMYKYFFDASFPFGSELQNNGYRILDDYTGAVYLGVNHNRPMSPWGNVYVSNSIGDRYSLSMAHVSQVWPSYDFGRVVGIDGVYITNVMENWRDDVDRSDSTLQTFISFNNGGAWQALAPPHFDSNGQRIVCTGRCSLHLHGETSLVSSLFGPVYSTGNTLGFIIGTGNVGESLSLNLADVNTYMSRDGGLNWVELRKGNSIYEFGDHGSIVVLAPFNEPTTKIYYSLDEGTTALRSVDIVLTPMLIYNIRVEPTATGEKFIIIGRRDGKGLVVGVDFSKVFTRTCALPDDYENWTPSNGKTEVDGLQCLMGRDITYRRRKAAAECFNSEDVDPVVATALCKCTEEDWECDVDFERDSNGLCVPSDGATPTFPPSYCPPGTTYNKTKGYRQIAGTWCQEKGGVNHFGDGPFTCPDPKAGSKSAKYGWVAAVVVVGIVLFIVAAAFAAISSEWIREKIPFVKRLHGWKVGYFGMQNEPDTIGEELEPEERGADEFSIGGDEEDEEKGNKVESKLDDSFNPRG